MKKNMFHGMRFVLYVLSAFAFSKLAFAAEETPKTKAVVVSVSDVFVPGGFDSEADAYVVVNGVFPNGCYRWHKAEVTRTGPLFHNVQSLASVTQGMCIMVLVPFTKEVRLGKLDRGTHTLRFTNGDGTYLEKTLRIE